MQHFFIDIARGRFSIRLANDERDVQWWTVPTKGIPEPQSDTKGVSESQPAATLGGINVLGDVLVPPPSLP